MSTVADLKAAVRTAVNNSPVPLRVVRDVRMEAHLAGVRAKRRLAPKSRTAERDLRGKRDLQMHFGCGSKILPGWVNIDGWAVPGVDIVTDLRQPLPLADGSCRRIFTEHVFEHIETDARSHVLAEFRRLMTSDGVLRIIVPDCGLFVDAYMRQDLEWFKAVGYDVATPAAGLNGIFREHFHRFIDDWASLTDALRTAGFSQIEKSTYGGSKCPELRVDTDEPSRYLCSIYVEARP